MKIVMHQRLLRIIGALVSAAAPAFLVACAHVVVGSPTYATETPSAELPLVKFTDLFSLILKPPEVGTVMKTQLDIVAIYTTAGSVPKDTVSDSKCAGALIAGAEPMYRGSGYQAINGLGMKDAQGQLADQGAAAFGDADEAHSFVETRIARWKDCVNRTLGITFPDKPPTNWIASGPSTSYGVHVLLRRQEGGRGYACSHGMAARSNIVADVLACSYDEARINDQVATIVNMILAKIRK